MSKLGDRARSSWRSSREGTVRTVRWIGGGITGALKGSRERVRAIAGRRDDPADGAGPKTAQPNAEEPRAEQADAQPGQPDAAASSLERLRSGGRRPILWIAAGLLLAAWIGWTVYVWGENGAAAGVGVLISWPVVFAALALIAAPLIGAGVFAHRHRLAGADPQATEGAGADEPAAGGRSAEETEEAAEDSATPTPTPTPRRRRRRRSGSGGRDRGRGAGREAGAHRGR